MTNSSILIKPWARVEISGDNIDLEGDNIVIGPLDSEKDAHLTIKCTLDHQKIEQNQKIVDLLILHYQHAEHNDITVASILSEIYHDATGKDIKSL